MDGQKRDAWVNESQRFGGMYLVELPLDLRNVKMFVK